VTAFGCIPDSTSAASKRFQMIDPRKAWHIEAGNATPPKGTLKVLSGNKFKVYLMDGIGNDGNKIDPRMYMDSADTKLNKVPNAIEPGNKPYLTWQNDIDGTFSRSSHINFCKEMLTVLEKVRMADKYRPKFKTDYFKNSLAMVYVWQKSQTMNTINL